ncbi:hypothetical protein [Pseudaquabacterium pictum]|uniref:Uncharacterized protein n=1 Tax=Pseudaquabacterium pictum TaxID=2315236 RepID=A0A480AVX2_9BURK|nr:hypothetical protein [Rubrivivax pictus]GCL64332.1 hypothetical protein AQPW35_34130 [Rubrivivax pictus]
MAGVKGCVKRSQFQPGQQQAWQAMRILRRFTLPQLLTTCPLLAHRTARHYLGRLRRCGYVERVARRMSGVPGSYDTYSLRRNTGPVAPITRKGSLTMYDPNTQDVWGDGGVLMPPDAPPEPKLSPLKPASVRWLALAAAGRRPEGALPDPENTGARAAVLKALRNRDLVDERGDLTPAGRAIGLANAKVIA